MAAALERNGEQPDGVAARSASSSSPLNRELATEANVKSMIEVANELTQGLDMLADHQVRFRFVSFRFVSFRFVSFFSFFLSVVVQP